MPDDYLNTALRMRDDAKILFEKDRYYNACYLSGYVAECYTKYVLISLVNNSNGVRYTQRDIKQLFKHDIESLMNEICNTSTMIPSQCRMDMRTKCTGIWNMSFKWNPYDRYGNNPNWGNKTVASSYLADAEAVCEYLLHLILVEGVLPL